MTYRGKVSALVALGIGLALPGTAAAGDETYWSGGVQFPGVEVPNANTSPRHTYSSNRTSWTTTIQPGCTVQLDNIAYIGLVSGDGSVKYTASACNYINDQFPNNTQLLRLYCSYGNGSWRTLVGKGAY